MRLRRKLKGATLLYVVVTGAGVATVLSGLTGFTAEVSRREGLNEEKATAIAALDGLQEMMRWEVRSMAYGGVEVDGYSEDVQTNTAADLATALPAATAPIRGIAGFVGSVSTPIPTNMIVPGGMVTAFSSDPINAFVENETQSKRSERKTMEVETVFGQMSGATIVDLGSDGLSYNYGRKTVIGVPWTGSTNLPRLKGEYFYMRGGLLSHVDSATSILALGSESPGMVGSKLGARGFPIATESSILSSILQNKIQGFDPQTKEVLWWKEGFAGGRQIVKEFERTDTFPVNWENQSVGGSTLLAPRYRLIHWSGSFNLAQASDIDGAALEITTNADTWVFINGQLSMDLGGIKTTMTKNRLDRRSMQTGSNRIDIFYAQRTGTFSFGLKTNLMFTPEQPVKILRDSKFDLGWASLTPNLSIMSGVQMVDVRGSLDSDDTDLGIEHTGAVTTRGVAYNAATASGDPGAKFTQATVTLVLFQTAWDRNLENAVKLYQRERNTDAWREVSWFATNSLDQDPYRRVTISTEEGALTEQNLLIAFDGGQMLGLESGVVRIADVSFVTSTLSRAPLLFVPPFEERADSYAIVARKKVEVERQVTLSGSLWGGDNLELKSAPLTITKDLWLEGEVKKSGTVSSAVLTVMGLSNSAQRPSEFVLDASTHRARSNVICSGGTINVLNAPAGHSAVNLFSDGNLTLSNLSIPSGGTIYVKGDLKIHNGITMNPGNELYLVVNGSVSVESPIVTSSTVTISRVFIIADKKVEFKRNVDWTGTIRTNEEVVFKARTNVTYLAPTLSPPGIVTRQ